MTLRTEQQTTPPLAFDVVIIGGGPAGATLGAVLGRHTGLRVALFERAIFPREHIGESFTHRLIPALHASGALPKVLASDCWVQKFGGFYAWDEGDPAVSLFEHQQWADDGVLRWTMHANRAEFDTILLDHAASCGVHVEQGVEVVRTTRMDGEHQVVLADGRRVRAGLVVEATGRHTRLTGRSPKQTLSSYRNIAVWTHMVGARPVETLDHDWNLFHGLGASGIGCAAFEDGWFWYIPVPRMVNGERVLTHSLGLVTDPRVLRQPGKDYTDVDLFLRTARDLPFIGELLADATPVHDRLERATNYSMMSEQLCDYDDGWMRLGDSAFFVDPLFSSGVSFAVTEAVVAARLIEVTAAGGLPEDDLRDIWRDYDQRWRQLGQSFATMIDQWYHAIARRHPDSVYWGSRAPEVLLDRLGESFHALVDADVAPDLNMVIANGRPAGEAFGDGPVAAAMRSRARLERGGVLRLADDVDVRPSHALAIGRHAWDAQPGVDAETLTARRARYWADPIAHGNDGPILCPPPQRCLRAHRPDGVDVTFPDTPRHRALLTLLRQGIDAATLLAGISDRERALVDRLLQTGAIVFAADADLPPGTAATGLPNTVEVAP